MTLQLQDALASLLTSVSPEANVQMPNATCVETVMEEDLTLPVLLFEMNKSLFDRAMESGFRLLGIE